jgi:hypothetical protein
MCGSPGTDGSIEHVETKETCNADPNNTETMKWASSVPQSGLLPYLKVGFFRTSGEVATEAHLAFAEPTDMYRRVPFIAKPCAVAELTRTSAGE